MRDWNANISKLKDLLKALSVSDDSGRAFGQDEAFNLWRDMTLRIRQNGNAVYLIGNGASASMASHVAADLEKNAHVRTGVFTDLSLITAIANDLGYENVFSEPLHRKMNRGDMLVAISSSGRSLNVLKAVREAVGLGGVVITLSAMGAENELRKLGAINFHVPADTFGAAETCHAAILHFWIDMMVKRTVS